MTQAQFKEIFDMYFEEIRDYIYYRSGNTELATDIAQDTFLRLWEKQFNISTARARPLLYKISGDQFVSNYRREKTAMKFKLHLKPEYTGQSPEENIQFEELSERYDLALQQLPEKQRTVFLMNRMDGMTYQEIAERLNLSVKAVEKRMTRALDFLRKALPY